ncbi:MAG: hypothetical protein ACJ73S_00560 [Mycobacteriales bacterium]
MLVRRISQFVPRLALVVAFGLLAPGASPGGAVLAVILALLLFLVLHAAAQAALFAGGDPVLVRVGTGRLLFRRYGSPVVEVRISPLGADVWPGPRGWCGRYPGRVATEYGPVALPLLVGAVLWLATGGWWGTLGIATAFVATYALLFSGTVARPGWLSRHRRDLSDELDGNAAVADALVLDPTATVTALEKARADHPTAGRVLARLGELYSAQGRRDDAVAAYRDALGRDTLGTRRAKAMARNNLAWLLLNGAEDSWPEGVPHAERAYAAWFSPTTAHTMALAHLRAGRPEQAAQILRVLRRVPGVRGAALAPLEALVTAATPAPAAAPAVTVPVDQAPTVLERPVVVPAADEATTVVEQPVTPPADAAETVIERRLPED